MAISATFRVPPACATPAPAAFSEHPALYGFKSAAVWHRRKKTIKKSPCITRMGLFITNAVMLYLSARAKRQRQEGTGIAVHQDSAPLVY